MRTVALFALAMLVFTGCADKNAETQTDDTQPYGETQTYGASDQPYEPAPGYMNYSGTPGNTSGAGSPSDSSTTRRQTPMNPRSAASDSEGASEDEVLSPASGRTYTVQKGDTLSSIARKFYGDQKRWKDIYSANKSLADPNKLAVGTRLVIP
jgi:nucleoid-associated protein YgaU